MSNEDEASVRHVLDVREKDGYTIVDTAFYPNDSEQTEKSCYTYTAHSDNPFWAGDEPLARMAEQIARAQGPSGTNREYLFQLAAAIRNITPVIDEHLSTLEQLVQDIVANDEQKVTREH